MVDDDDHAVGEPAALSLEHWVCAHGTCFLRLCDADGKVLGVAAMSITTAADVCNEWTKQMSEHLGIERSPRGTVQ